MNLTNLINFTNTQRAIVLSVFMLIFFIAFNFTDTPPPPSGWYQQFMPDLGGRTIQDITFLDSLIGYASARQTGDTSYILKTTNGGDNWQIIYRNFFAMTQIQFMNINTRYAVGAYLFKTANGGFNWNQVNAPPISPENLFVLNEDTIWIISSESLTGGVYRTTNGGVSWQHQFSGGTQNPDKIYMYNARIGFITKNVWPQVYNRTYKTTNGGSSWFNINADGFFDISFADSLTGWRTDGDTMKYTSDGGVSWINQIFPHGGIIFSNVMTRFSVLNRDTLWGCGGYILFPNNRVKSILWRTTNRGQNWLFQLPDTNFFYFESFIKFTDRLHGWAYSIYPTGIHTTTGGDTTFYTGLQQVSTKIPEQFKLYQNYPNPFNPRTVIKYQITSIKEQIANVKLIVYDITGKEIIKLVNAEQSAGTYEVDFSGNGLSSGVYFYSLIVNGNTVDTKKMLMLK